MDSPIDNVLYFAVFPQIVVSGSSFGRTEQILTLVPDRNFASAFSKDEVEAYIQVFKNRLSHITGGHVTGYDVEEIPATGGRVYVQATQHVS
jgi:hypothetical protein